MGFHRKNRQGKAPPETSGAEPPKAPREPNWSTLLHTSPTADIRARLKTPRGAATRDLAEGRGVSDAPVRSDLQGANNEGFQPKIRRPQGSCAGGYGINRLSAGNRAQLAIQDWNSDLLRGNSAPGCFHAGSQAGPGKSRRLDHSSSAFAAPPRGTAPSTSIHLPVAMD